MRIAVTGASGHVGSALVDELAERGHDVVAIVRNPNASPEREHVQRIAGDLSDPESLREGFASADATFLLPGFRGLADAARKAGAARVVQLSGGSAGSGDATNAITRFMRDTEADLLATDIDWTILRPTSFMTNALAWSSQVKNGDTVTLPFADVALALTHPRDIAAVAAEALTETSHNRMVYRVTGGSALTPAEQVAEVGRVLGRTLTFHAQSNADARRDMMTSTPPEYVAAAFSFYVYGSIDETSVSPTVTDLTGRPPRPFAQWVRDNRAAFE